MDLYNDGVAYSVKKGGGAQKLSVVVDQSIEGIRCLRNEDVDFPNEVINKLNMLMLKAKLVKWKQQMILWGYEPIIQINYKKR